MQFVWMLLVYMFYYLIGIDVSFCSSSLCVPRNLLGETKLLVGVPDSEWIYFMVNAVLLCGAQCVFIVSRVDAS